MPKVATTVTSSIAAPRRPFYKWLVPGVFFDQLETVLHPAAGLPGVAKTTGTTGPWDIPGSYRIVHTTDGYTVREEVTNADTPDYFAYKVTEFTQPFIRRLVKEARGQWWFTDAGAGTHIKWTYTCEGRSLLSLFILVPVIKVLWNRYMAAGVKIIKQRAEKEVGMSSR